MTTDSEQFADLLKKVRDQLGISQEDLARELGVSFATVNRWENGKTKPMKLARAQFDSFCAKMKRRGELDLD
jgi:transcriptional regulator with XRE-family HTH domain